ncbi:hypothetical protein EZV62_003108 [Acer yangbiense]|uniref:Pectinesterase catalytic domain-containing protein n=1 Tax=Acer yangbiense TaxID=1000413 RepID=A0A5C7IG05_9ROSI|nr:hypothetical protein EZV62_003108 [Acer yangbiense]
MLAYQGTLYVHSDRANSTSTVSSLVSEYQNTGACAGTGTSNRVNWKGFKVITSASEAQGFTPARFIAGLYKLSILSWEGFSSTDVFMTYGWKNEDACKNIHRKNVNVLIMLHGLHLAAECGIVLECLSACLLFWNHSLEGLNVVNVVAHLPPSLRCGVMFEDILHLPF